MDHELTDLGITTEPFAMPKPPRDDVVVGGLAGNTQWTRVVTRRVAHTLWYHLTRLLFPDRAKQITTRAATSVIRSDKAPSITTHVEVFRGKDNYIELLGTGGKADWLTRLHEHDARRLWAALDKMLFPLGWEGSDQRIPPPDS